MAKLTAKQEKFCQEFMKTGNQSEAYRTSYDVGEGAKNEGIWVNACKVMANAKVSLRVFELQELAQERTLVTVESLTKELEEARQIAKKIDQPSAMNGSSMGKAKLHGLDTQKIDMNLSGSVQVEELEKGKERNAKRVKPKD